ncbi:hypothetical protein PACTADRAFT_32267 [Pachysolen tannophilus NRRL Y-2460]|uniref:Uncharacterized protein n=1 Tax=Pachysolen tannophilus NRRL Y-2460 TaxID=669874 RepID=A0A1E4TYE6_PACTA|nr:hypothetical protein PACTADRAFT_32267 [Pachysolen tannophilus NRRL Y-2460]
MVQLFMVHPDLRVTDCAEACDINLKKYEVRYFTALDNYNRLIEGYAKLTSASGSKASGSTAPTSHHGSGTSKATTSSSSSSSSSTAGPSRGAAGSYKFLPPELSPRSSNASESKVPVDEDDIFKEANFNDVDMSKLTDKDLLILKYYKLLVNYSHLEYNYLKTYCGINKIMKQYFSKAVLSPDDEEKGLALVGKEMQNFRMLERKLEALKDERSGYEVKLNEIKRKELDYEKSNIQTAATSLPAISATSGGAAGGGSAGASAGNNFTSHNPAILNPKDLDVIHEDSEGSPGVGF